MLRDQRQPADRVQALGRLRGDDLTWGGAPAMEVHQDLGGCFPARVSDGRNKLGLWQTQPPHATSGTAGVLWGPWTSPELSLEKAGQTWQPPC